MADKDPETDDRIDTVCFTCKGEAHIPMPVMAVMNGHATTVMTFRACPQCKDSKNPGWLPGIQAPI